MIEVENLKKGPETSWRSVVWDNNSSTSYQNAFIPNLIASFSTHATASAITWAITSPVRKRGTNEKLGGRDWSANFSPNLNPSFVKVLVKLTFERRFSAHREIDLRQSPSSECSQCSEYFFTWLGQAEIHHIAITRCKQTNEKHEINFDASPRIRWKKVCCFPTFAFDKCLPAATETGDVDEVVQSLFQGSSLFIE